MAQPSESIEAAFRTGVDALVAARCPDASAKPEDSIVTCTHTIFARAAGSRVTQLDVCVVRADDQDERRGVLVYTLTYPVEPWLARRGRTMAISAGPDNRWSVCEGAGGWEPNMVNGTQAGRPALESDLELALSYMAIGIPGNPMADFSKSTLEGASKHD